MDPITHGLLGAAVAQVLAQKKIGKAAAWIGAAAAMSPDLDIFIRSADHPLLSIIYHRHFTHALIFAPVIGLIATLLFVALFKQLRPKWPYVFLAATFATLTHGLLDSATSYGTLLLWPWSDQRVAWDLISIVDPIFTGALMIGVIIAYVWQKRTPVIIALLFCSSYLGFAYSQHSRALSVQHELAQSRHQTDIQKNRAMPKFGHLWGYTSVYIYDNRIYLDDIRTPLFKAAYAAANNAIPLFNAKDLPPMIKNNAVLFEDFEVFDWFSDGYVTAISQQPLVLADMRYVQNINPLVPRWGIKFPEQAEDQHVAWVSRFD